MLAAIRLIAFPAQAAMLMQSKREGKSMPHSLKALIGALVIFGTCQAAGAQKISVDGSTGTAPLVDALGKAFASRHGISIEIGKGLGTKARFEALASGKIDIAMASHGLRVTDITERGMTVYRIAMTPVLFGANKSVKLRGLSETQICSLYEGKAGNWKDLGGPDLVIVPLVRPESEVDMEVVRDGIGCFKGLKLPGATRSLARAGDMAQALAETPGSVGMTSATFVAQSKGNITAFRLNGATADEASIASGAYRLTRDAFLVIGKSPSEAVRTFITFVRGPEGAAVIRANGAIPAKS